MKQENGSGDAPGLRARCLSAARAADPQVFSESVSELLDLSVACGPAEHMATFDWLLRHCWPEARRNDRVRSIVVLEVLTRCYVALREEQAPDGEGRALASLSLLGLTAVLSTLKGDRTTAAQAASRFDEVADGFGLADFIEGIETGKIDEDETG